MTWKPTIYLKFDSASQAGQRLTEWLGEYEQNWAAVDIIGTIYKHSENEEFVEADGFHVNVRVREGYEIHPNIIPHIVDVQNPKRVFF